MQVVKVCTQTEDSSDPPITPLEEDALTYWKYACLWRGRPTSTKVITVGAVLSNLLLIADNESHPLSLRYGCAELKLLIVQGHRTSGSKAKAKPENCATIHQLPVSSNNAR